MSNPREYISTRVDLAELCKTARPSEIAQQGKEAGRERKSYQLTHGFIAEVPERIMQFFTNKQ